MKNIHQCLFVAGALGFVVSGCAAESASEDGVPAPTNADSRHVSSEVRAWLEERQAGLNVVATTHTRSGQIIDWIPASSQVATGELAAKPPSPPIGNKHVAKSCTTELEMQPEARGPEGTVPVVRPDVDRINAPGSVADFLSKYGKAGIADRMLSPMGTNYTKPLSIGGSSDVRYAGAVKNVVNFGVEARINVWAPVVQQGFFTNDMTLAQISVSRGIGNQLQTAEAGWQENPSRLGNALPHFFIYYTTNNYTQDGANLGSYDRVSTGWVQVSQTVTPGNTLAPTSTPGTSNQLEVWLKWEFFQGNWWLWFADQWIGYYPGTLYSSTGLQSQAAVAGVQGEMADSNIFSTSPTDMGSGQFASAGFGFAAYMRQISYFTSANGLGPTSYTTPAVTVTIPGCYSLVGSWGSVDPFFKSSFFFGGPGQSATCP